ncbi:glutathione S-transferase N-terminal domain-containing protein [Alkalilimnicola ehrlichii MLHE-1]|uniref:Glutathione S-transferase-like protein n=1 Tax=Alkalilimnicola ehrlichii (strain ATCC BAA-1101 / DSM 17681 / MLHE-1) TaxID=187272 RepID=Q0A8M9_ALKEH|nr:glutathione S-transferase N-terminal domain-containing protein [Alkalilimnicola ehrlichii]ABI56808.1 Glutathione S-transferase-like protein [Alkalilimnicola ehrlichii MLHE-1]
MIDLYTWPTPNGQKVHIALEELGLPYRVIPVDITAGAQFEKAFLQVSPNNKIPAIEDPDGPDGEPLRLFESGAILLYLAEKAGALIPAAPRARWETLQWLMFQMGSLGPMLGQAHHFRQYAPERIDYAVQRYTREAQRLYRVLDRHLAGRDWMSAEYSVADIAIYPWVCSHASQGLAVADYPALSAWKARLDGRLAVQRGMAVLQDRRRAPEELDDEARYHLFKRDAP